MDSGRLKYQQSDKYVDKVLIGNWFERKCKFTKNPHNFESTYRTSYSLKPFSANDPALVWDQLFRGLGYGARVLFDHQAPHFLENKSTTYDLAFRYFPKLSDGPIPREQRFRLNRYEPEQDYARNYGNITKSGLLNYYKEYWRCENQDPRVTLTTNYQDTFLTPTKEYLKRWAIPLTNSSAMNNTNRQFGNLKLRNKQVLCVPENNLVTVPPVEPRCNPITWECCDTYKEVPNRCTKS